MEQAHQEALEQVKKAEATQDEQSRALAIAERRASLAARELIKSNIAKN